MPSEVPQTPRLTPLSFSHLCARYLQAQFKFKLNARSPRSRSQFTGTSAVPPLLLPDPIVSELDRIAHHLVNAFLNPIEVSWDVVRYAAKLPKKQGHPGSQSSQDKEESRQRQYPPLNDSVKMTRPCIITDLHGAILAWYLPGILNESRQGKLWAATEKLNPLLRTSRGKGWRNDPKYFQQSHESSVDSGAINFSPAWFELGHETTQPFPQAAKIFDSPTALCWLDCISESSSILSAILAVIHPELYDIGRETLKRLRDVPEILGQDVLTRWTSAFNGVAVISQRNTPAHRDLSSMPHWYDLLVTLGQYEKCDFNFPGLGVSLEYGPGTVVGLSGMVLEHEVASFKGDRVCYAYFMKDSVHEWAKARPGTWMNTKHYE